MRQMQGGGARQGRGRTDGVWQEQGAACFLKTRSRTTFADVAGVDEAKEDVQELVEFLRDPE